jgi:hypothetical protein
MCGGAQKDVIAVFMWATWDVYISLISLSLLRHQLRTKNPLSPCLCQRKTTICLTYVWRRSKRMFLHAYVRSRSVPSKQIYVAYLTLYLHQPKTQSPPIPLPCPPKSSSSLAHVWRRLKTGYFRAEVRRRSAP